MLHNKNFWGFLSLFLALVQYIPYYRGIWTGRVRPHVFSWLIWVLPVAITFFAQTVKGGGAGAWVSGFSALLTLSVFCLSLKRGETSFTVMDWTTLGLAMAAILSWVVTQDPLMAVIFSSVANILGFVPTARKCMTKPYGESLTSYVASVVKWSCSLLALQSLSLTTIISPLGSIVAGTAFVVFVLMRRSQVPAPVSAEG